ncbi:MAG: class I SAM-dependent methyltransferase [Chitinispirillaceae bacterium]|nr:class I SAM-dependent methyltransferase [Chitinispirillaceae bacterium]
MSEEHDRQRDYWNREIVSFDAIYSKKKNAFGRWLDWTFRKDMYERYEYTLTHAEPIKNRDFLDVGCGTGRYAFELVRRGCRHVTGIDISEEMIDHCKRQAVEEGIEGKTEFIVTNLLDFTDARQFHTCIGIGLFDYISNPLPVLKKMRECALDKVIASFPRLWTWRAPVRKLRLAIRGCNVRFFSQRQIGVLVNTAGFSGYTIEKIGKLYCITAQVAGN